MNERLKNARKSLKLSHNYVAKHLGIPRTSVGMIEDGTRKVSAEELMKLSELYGVSVEELLYGKIYEKTDVGTFAVKFHKLCERDRREIIALIELKLKYKENRND